MLLFFRFLTNKIWRDHISNIAQSFPPRRPPDSSNTGYESRFAPLVPKVFQAYAATAMRICTAMDTQGICATV